MSQPTGVIHDIGYRPYEGVRQGRAYAATALALHSLRGVFGLGRPARSKIIPFLVAATMLLPAIVSIAVMALLKEQALPYAGFGVAMQAVLTVFLAAQAPYLVAPDLRFKVLPLYLSRPVTVTDYVGAKFAALVLAVFLLLAAPLTLIYLGELLVELDTPVRTGEYLSSMGGAVIYAVVLGAIALTLASFTPRRGLGVATVIAFFMFTLACSGVFSEVLGAEGYETASRWSLLISPFFLVEAVQVNLFGTLPTPGEYPPGPGPAAIVLAVVALALTALFLRYRKAAAA